MHWNKKIIERLSNKFYQASWPHKCNVSTQEYLMKFIITTMFLSILYSPALLAAERLGWSMPEGWKVGYQKGNIIELVKKDESVQNWTRLITFQQYKSSEKTDGNTLITHMEQGFSKDCKEVELIPFKNGFQGGYEIVHAILLCTTNKANGKGEIYQVKTLKGKEMFFVVQYAYRVEPFKTGEFPLEESEMKQTIDYVAKVQIVER